MTQNQALTILTTGANVFLTGEPGSGKSFTINRYVSYLLEHGINPAITASTGIAATHIGGMTIHSWSGIGINKNLTTHDLNLLSKNEKLKKRIEQARVLIIDEISMLSAQTLDLVDLVCKTFKKDERPFGGIQVVLVGDFFQLPPVSQMTKPKFAFQSGAWVQLNPKICYLTEQHRQEDHKLLSLLSGIRKNTLEDCHYNHLESRINDTIINEKDITKLYSHNADVDYINEKKLLSLGGKTHQYKMESSGRRSLIPGLIKGCLSPEELKLKKEAVVMFTKNNQQEGYVNGTIGTVVDFDQDTDYPIVQSKSGEKIKVGPVSWVVEENGKDVARIVQIPLRLAWAITIHKSQGMSLDAAIIDLRQVFEFGQGYVALSRIRSLEGLYLLGYNQNSLLVHPEILKKDHEFRTLSGQAYIELSQTSDLILEERCNDFLLKSGGTLEKVDPKEHFSKPKTCELTLKLIEEGKSLQEIIKERGLTEGTIISHLEKLVLDEKITREQAKTYLPKEIYSDLPKIKAAFEKEKSDKLSPVFKRLKGKYSFEILKLAKIVLGIQSKFEFGKRMDI